jgi:hypothetical protein
MSGASRRGVFLALGGIVSGMCCRNVTFAPQKNGVRMLKVLGFHKDSDGG